jgi:hypothetical protein
VLEETAHAPESYLLRQEIIVKLLPRTPPSHPRPHRN